MRLPKFEYLEPRSLKKASEALTADPKGTFLLAGGTDLLVNMKHGVIQPKRLINLKAIPHLNYITEGKDGLRIGALTTLHDLASSTLVQDKYPVLGQCALEVAAYTHQVMGTLGGNLCQENRCRYYNQSVFWRSARAPCYKVGGEICHVVRKSKECHSTYRGDMAPVLIAMDAKVKLVGWMGNRTIPLKRLYTQIGKKPLSLRKGEILKEIFIPSPSGQTLYLKWRLRGTLEFPMVSLALHLEKNGEGNIDRAKVILSGLGTGPLEAFEIEKMLKGVSLDDGVIEKISNQMVKEISPMRTSIASPNYQRKMAGILLRQGLEKFKS
ncbi:MAG: FAD binding domain-containing protein [Syntrophaceae bacterium]|nr:FAD binding domain-containing protein [Syntrophaceae bacterium]